MKVVLFCGGFGMRMREYSESIPKPMVMIGNRPILWHIMKYYAHFGHKDFILCLGWKANVIKQYFLQYDECISNDFVLKSGGRSIELISSDIHDWNITFVDTGARSNIGQRLLAVAHHLEGEERFFANYSDGLCDVNLTDMLDAFGKSNSIASFVSVKPSQSFHSVKVTPDGKVNEIEPVGETGMLMNGGFFAFRNEIFDYLNDGDELVEEPFRRLIKADKLSSYTHHGFWSCMDTFKEKQDLDDLYASGSPPWVVWEDNSRDEIGVRHEPALRTSNPKFATNGDDHTRRGGDFARHLDDRHDFAPT